MVIAKILISLMWIMIIVNFIMTLRKYVEFQTSGYSIVTSSPVTNKINSEIFCENKYEELNGKLNIQVGSIRLKIIKNIVESATRVVCL